MNREHKQAHPHKQSRRLNTGRIDPEFFEINGHKLPRNSKTIVPLHLAPLYDYTEMVMPVCVLRAKNPGPVVFISGAVHGDEIIGTEIIRRLLIHKRLKLKAGTLLIIPIVNVFGYNNQSRYLPDRRDLNRSFPGSKHGSLAARIAYLFHKEIVLKSAYGLDLHSGAIHRANLPHIRAALHDPETAALAKAFGTPVILDTKLHDGSLRAEADGHNAKILLFEGGEALRFDETVIRIGISGVFSVLEQIGSVAPLPDKKPHKNAYVASSSYWIRAPQSGAVRVLKSLGAHVQPEDKLALISDVFGQHKAYVRAKTSGIVIGENRLPLVNRGDALFHIATFEDHDTVKNLVMEYADVLDLAPY